MPKYLVQARYTTEGIQGLVRDSASGRRADVQAAVRTLGGKVEAFYYAFGGDDVVLILDLPNNIKAAALGLTISGSGAVRVRTGSKGNWLQKKPTPHRQRVRRLREPSFPAPFDRIGDPQIPLTRQKKGRLQSSQISSSALPHLGGLFLSKKSPCDSVTVSTGFVFPGQMVSSGHIITESTRTPRSFYVDYPLRRSDRSLQRFQLLRPIRPIGQRLAHARTNL
jgi:uncharacterized protein with GYD domain